MAKIQDIRSNIDKIDDQLVKLINKRGELAVKIGQEKSKVNMHEMSFDIDQNVSIMPVLNLHDVAQQTIGSE